VKPRRLQTRFVIAGFLVAVATVASGIWSAYTFIQLSRLIGETLRESQQEIDLTATLASALEREDDALLLAVNGDRERAAQEVASQRALFDQAYGALWTILKDPTQREMAASLRRNADAYWAAGDKLLADARLPQAPGLYHEGVNPILRRTVMDSANLRELTFRAMQRASIRARDQATRAIGVVAGVSLVAVLVSTLAAVHLARVVGRPIGELTASVDALRLGQFDRRVSVGSTDELGRLAQGFNRMAEALAEFRRSNLGEVVRAKETLESTLAVLPDAVIVIDPEGQITSLNPLAHAVLAAAGSGSPRRVEELPLSADWVKAVGEALHGVRSSGAPLETSRTLSVTLDGQPRRFAPAVVPVPASSSAQYGAVVVLTDVTEYVRLDELRAELIALVSHELKTPLTTLRMNLLLLGERPDDLTPRQREVLSTASAGCEDLAGTIDELLDLSRIEAGQLRLALAPIDLYPLVAQAVHRFRPRYEEAGVRLEVSREAPRATILADAPRLGLVLSNLLSNALNYTPEGGQVTLAVSSMQNARSARVDYLQIAVTDTGPGIAEEFRERVFEKFFRIESRRPLGRIAVQGAGFGLYLCRQIVEAHGGAIRCEPGSDGRGTRIALRLPAAEAAN
jgi:NtrC-family two-component system sensor histidine kinase KinB